MPHEIWIGVLADYQPKRDAFLARSQEPQERYPQGPMPRTCVIRLLGGFLVEVDGRPVPSMAWRHRRGSDLVKLLSLTPTHRLHREQLIEALWPELPPDAATANLRKAVYFARRGLSGPETIESGPDLVALWPEGDLVVDVERFEAAAVGALAAGAGDLAAAELFTGELLPEDRYAEWTEPRREQVRALYVDLLGGAGRWEKILEIERSDERAHRALMERYLRSGNRQAAIRQFQRLRQVLRVDLGVGPEEETVALFERALAAGDAQTSSPEERTQALIARGLVAWNRRELDDAEQIAEEVRQLASEHQLAKELGEASALLGLVAWAQGNWSDRFRTEFAQALQLTSEQSAFVFDAHICLAEASMGTTDSDSLAALARELVPAAERAGSMHGQALASLLLGEAELFSGRLEESHKWLESATDLFQKVGADSGCALALLRLAETAIARHDRAEADDLLARARELAERSELAPHLVIRVFAAMIDATDDQTRQLQALEEAERELRPGDVCGPCSIGFRISAAIACARAGELVKARRCLADAENLAGMWQGGPWRAATWEARASLRLAEGDASQAAALLREAASMFGECGRPLDDARCAAAAESLATG